jgi:hypothetical protein
MDYIKLKTEKGEWKTEKVDRQQGGVFIKVNEHSGYSDKVLMVKYFIPYDNIEYIRYS